MFSLVGAGLKFLIHMLCDGLVTLVREWTLLIATTTPKGAMSLSAARGRSLRIKSPAVLGR